MTETVTGAVAAVQGPAGQLWTQALALVSGAGTPAGLALICGLGVTMYLESLMRLKGRQTPATLIWPASMIVTGFLFYPACCWIGKIPWRGPNAALGLVAGAGAPLLTWALAKVGIDLDAIAAKLQGPPSSPPPSSPTPPPGPNPPPSTPAA